MELKSIEKFLEEKYGRFDEAIDSSMFLIDDVVFNKFYQCTGTIIDLDTSDKEVTIEWENKKAGTKTYNMKNFVEIKLLAVSK